MTILVDTREGKPYTFKTINPHVKSVVIKTATLQTGDYSVEMNSAESDRDRIAIERKSLADLYATLTAHRTRFFRECERMVEFGYAAIVVEAGMDAILAPNEHLIKPTKTSPRSIFGTLFALAERHRIGVWTCPGREFAEQITFKLLERWHRDHNE